jgi:FixJ family two-component response regulator
MRTVELHKPNAIRNASRAPEDSVCIAVVDDDMMYRQAIEVSLKKVPGSRVMGFESGEACFKNYHTVKPDILVLDYRLCADGSGATMNGIEVLRKLKQVDGQTTVIFISGTANTDVAVTAIKAGAVDFITKDKNGLSRLIHQVRKASIKVRVKRQESRVARWIAAGILCIAAIVSATVLADTGGFNDVWNWTWFGLSILCAVMVIRTWVRSSRHDYQQLRNIEYSQNGKWVD